MQWQQDKCYLLSLLTFWVGKHLSALNVSCCSVQQRTLTFFCKGFTMRKLNGLKILRPPRSILINKTVLIKLPQCRIFGVELYITSNYFQEERYSILFSQRICFITTLFITWTTCPTWYRSQLYRFTWSIRHQTLIRGNILQNLPRSHRITQRLFLSSNKKRQEIVSVPWIFWACSSTLPPWALTMNRKQL